MRPVILSERLRTVAHMVTAGNAVCDVGCDHGFVPVYLLQQGISPKVIAMDLRDGPLCAAREHVAAYGLEGKIETRLSDGLHKFESGEAETLICAGMGGGLMMRILAQEREKTDSFREMILQPQSEIEKFRRFLRESGYGILDEEMIQEDGKFYQVIRAAAGAQISDGCGEKWTAGMMSDELCKLTDRYGPVLLRKKTPVFFSFLDHEASVYEEILANLRKEGLTDEKRRARYAQVEVMLTDNRRALDLSWLTRLPLLRPGRSPCHSS